MAVRRGNRLEVPSGAAPRLAELLRNAGHDVCVSDHRRVSSPRLGVEQPYLAELSDVRLAIAEAAIANPSGLFVVTGDREAAEHVAVLARVYSHANLVVVASTCKQCDGFINHLQALLSECIRSLDSQWKPDDARVCVATRPRFTSASPEVWDIVVVLDAHAFVNTQSSLDMLALEQQRLYGFVPLASKLDRQSSLMLEAVIGPRLGDFAAAPDAPVHVAFCDYALGKRSRARDALDRKRTLIWGNDRRNGLVSAIARAYLECDVAALLQHGVSIAPERHENVTILVESPEHGRELLAALPGWELVTFNEVPRFSASAPSSDAPSGRIVTLMAAVRMEWLPPGVLIRADGGSSDIDRLCRKVLQPFGGGAVRLVDFADRDRNATMRRDAYRRAGHRVTGPTWFVGH